MTMGQNKLFFARLTARQWSAVILTLVLGVGLTFGGFQLARKEQHERSIANLKGKAAEHHNLLRRELAGAIQAVQAIGAFYDASKEITRQEFGIFTKELLASRAGIQALEWIPRVPHSQREQYVRAAQRDGFPNFQITERVAQGRMQKIGQRSEYFPVYFVEPMKGNEPALGFDLASSPARLKSLNQARDTGQMVASGRIRLVQETGEQFGFLVFQPIYRQGVPLDTVEDRRRHLRGFALGVFRIGDLVEAFLADTPPAGINISIYDLSTGREPSFLYFHRSRVFKGLPQRAKTETLSKARLRFAEVVSVADRQWKILCEATPWLIAKSRTSLSWGVLGGGLLASLLLALSVLSIVRKTASLKWTNQQLEKDIAERKKAEAAVRSSENKYSTVFRFTPAAVILTSLADGRIVEVNDRVLQSLGYYAGEMIGRTSTELKIWANPAEREKYFEMLREHGRVTNLEADFRTKSGEIRKGLVSGEIIQLEDGPHVLGVTLDITDHKLAELALLERDELLRSMGEVAKVGGWEFDAQTLKGTWTDEVAKIHDLDPGAETNAELGLSFYMGESRDKIEAAVKEAIEKGKPYDLELEMVTGKGKHKWVRTIGHPIKEGGKVVKVKGSFQDITDSKGAAEARREREAELAAIYENAPLIMMLVDQNRRIRRINTYGQKFVGASEAEIIRWRNGKEPRCLGAALHCLDSLEEQEGCDLTPQCGQCMIRRAVMDTLKTGQSHHLEEASLPILVEGERKDLSFILSTTLIRLGKENLALVSMVDITDRKRAEEASRKSQAHVKAVLDASPDMIFRFNREGICTFCKPSVYFPSIINEGP